MEQFIPFVLKNWYLFAALVVILGLLVGGEIMRKLRGIPAINPTQALQLINHQDAVVLDIRDGGEFRTGHIPEARHVPLSELESRLGELAKFKDRPLIVYCNSGARAIQACTRLKKEGFTAVHNLSGGLPAWVNAGLPVHKK
ncbi:MAG TPA: rhodanese-like domain-containing protein [Candidatus Competibacteraceae bacterium]|nr:rhodanese-like domain-containing protein [Candidatus Competibacteraceae bacterium]